MQYDAGMLDRSIVLQRNTASTKNSVGEIIPAWTTLATVFANYMPVSDSEKMLATEQFATISARFVVRFSSEVSTLNAKDQISFDGRIWNILGVKEVERNRWLEITAGARGER